MKPDAGPIRILVIDDSPTAREMLVALFSGTPDIQVVAVGANGEEAISLARKNPVDLITMDVRMPKLDGMEATRVIMRENPKPIIMVTSSIVHTDVDLTFKALEAGALAVVKKPGLSDPETCEKLIQTVRLMSRVPVIHHWGRRERPANVQPQKQHIKEPVLPHKVALVGIASSTGGPGVLASILKDLPVNFPVPILIVQHMTSGFSSGLADWLSTQTALPVSLAGHGELPQPGTVLIAPDDYHLQFGPNRRIELVKGQPYKGLRPSANYLFHSMAQVLGSQALGIILTGMGDDGVDGIEELYRAGGYTIAQDEQSCVVYGMPREAVMRSAVRCVCGPDQIAAALLRLAQPVKES